MENLEVRTPTDPLLLPSDLVNDSLIVQCMHILINIYGHMGMEATSLAIANPIWMGVTMDARNDGM